MLGPSFSGDGNLIAFATWNRQGGPGPGYHVFLFDKSAKKLIDLPGLNSQAFDDRMPALSGDGRFLAFASNRKGGAGLTDIYLYDRKESKNLPMCRTELEVHRVRTVAQRRRQPDRLRFRTARRRGRPRHLSVRSRPASSCRCRA